MDHQEIVVPARFRGPPESGNGGYVAGVLAERFHTRDDSAVEVTLRAPIPLDTPLRLAWAGEGALTLMRGEQLIAEARPAPLELEVPAAPGFAAALAARDDSPSFYQGINPLIDGTGFHPVCVCCGVEAGPEGLRVHAAPVPGFDGVAAAWRPDPALADADGYLPERVVWTALDCPGQFAWLAGGIRTGLLGRMTARLLRPVPTDADLVVTGWCLDIERKKHFAGTALFHGDELCALARQVWIGRWD